MKNLIRKIIDYCFYNFLVDLLEEEFRIKIFLCDGDFKFEIHMLYVPCVGSSIRLENGIFKVNNVIHSTYGMVVHLEGKFIKGV